MLSKGICSRGNIFPSPSGVSAKKHTTATPINLKIHEPQETFDVTVGNLMFRSSFESFVMTKQ